MRVGARCNVPPLEFQMHNVAIVFLIAALLSFATFIAGVGGRAGIVFELFGILCGVGFALALISEFTGRDEPRQVNADRRRGDEAK